MIGLKEIILPAVRFGLGDDCPNHSSNSLGPGRSGQWLSIDPSVESSEFIRGKSDIDRLRIDPRAASLCFFGARHRVANSLQIIASILLIKARTVNSEETRLHLQDAHRRVMSVASVQEHLQGSSNGEQIAVGPYLSKLCETLGNSMIGDNRLISLKVVAGDGTSTSREAVSVGLIVTELVINALKHAFPESKRVGHIVVGYEADGNNWKLSISDNGAGMPDRKGGTEKTGLGTILIKALAQQLDAHVDVTTGPKGTTLSITHATFVSRLPTAA